MKFTGLSVVAALALSLSSATALAEESRMVSPSIESSGELPLPTVQQPAPVSDVPSDAPIINQQPEMVQQPAVSQPVPDDSNYKHFEAWLDEFRAEALSKGIKQSVLDDAFADIDEPVEDVITKDKSQPEVKTTFPKYVKRVLTQKKIDAARAAWRANENLLNRVEAKFGVQPQFLLALWGVESNFGQNQGSHSIVESLTTLAYDGRRAAFFRKELLNALRILQDEHIKSADLLGSWAGAMGQTQFMPSSFLAYAVDFDGDGKKDIWSSDEDALASIANYLHSKGWDDNAGWGVAVSLPDNPRMDWAALKERLPLSEWKRYGVRQKNGEMLRGIKAETRLVLLDGDVNQAYLVYPNYDIIMDWNRSVYFATTIGMLADALGDEP